MKWTNDGDRLSTLHMRHIIEPKKKFDNYMVGDHGLAVYPGYAGQWTFLILAIGGKDHAVCFVNPNSPINET